MDLLVQDYPFDAKPNEAKLMCNYKQMAVFLDYVSSSIYGIDRYLKQATELKEDGVTSA